MIDWQPIETAPKDGTTVQIWTEGDGWIPHAYYDSEWIAKYQNWTGCPPSHWMPLPDPPEVA